VSDALFALAIPLLTVGFIMGMKRNAFPGAYWLLAGTASATFGALIEIR
jgi:hypothetical protein